MPFYKATTLHYLLTGVSLEDCPGWGPIHSPAAGVVVQAEDGWPEPKRLQPVKDEGGVPVEEFLLGRLE